MVNKVVSLQTFQGDPLSVAIFNMITCLFADPVLQSELNSAYRFKATGDSLQLLLFADDAALVANSVQNLQKLCKQTDAFLLWSKIEPKVIKCRSLAFKKRPTNGFFDPNIAIGGEKVPYGGDNEIKFLGLPVDLDLSVSKRQELLLQRLRVFCERVDTLPLKSVQKLKIYKLCICPRLSWLLSVQEYPFSCIERHLEPIATSYLKKWCHISRCANTSCLYLPSTSLGLNMPSISSLYKSLQIGHYYRLLSSSDNRVQRLSDSKCLREKGDTRHKFRALSATVSILDLAKVSSQKMKSHLKSHVQSADATR